MAHCVAQSTAACTCSAVHLAGRVEGRTGFRAVRGAGASPATRMLPSAGAGAGLSLAQGCTLAAVIIVPWYAFDSNELCTSAVY